MINALFCQIRKKYLNYDQRFEMKKEMQNHDYTIKWNVKMMLQKVNIMTH